jgi:hypothetical protein
MKTTFNNFERFNGSRSRSLELMLTRKIGFRLSWELNPSFKKWYLPTITHYRFIATHFHSCLFHFMAYFTVIHKRIVCV